MAKIDNILLKTKFRGSMLGSLVGDCLGGPFEGDEFTHGIINTVQKCFDKLDGPYFKSPYRSYSDDTVMTKGTAQTLIDKPAVDYKYMAQLYVQEYFKEPKRGYGHNVVETFKKLKHTNFVDIYLPAKEQFNGTGSFGNGGAMRISPIALYFHNNYAGMVEAAKKSTEITHTHQLGINGALLQCIAVHQSLQADPKVSLDVYKFLADLDEKMKQIEDRNVPSRNSDEDPFPYKTQLQMIKQLLQADKPDDPIRIEEIIGVLGNTVNALYSVPTAIYCFLKAHTGFPEVKCDNIFRRAIQYACAMGGDTDTIASMAGAITGAYYGEEIISENLVKHCEDHKDILKLADQLFDASQAHTG